MPVAQDNNFRGFISSFLPASSALAAISAGVLATVEITSDPVSVNHLGVASAKVGLSILLAVGACSALWLHWRQHCKAVSRELYDQLTGLPNRVLFQRQVEQYLASPQAARDGLSVIFIDLDDLRDVNDSLGHLAGDNLLIEIASRLREAAPIGAARLGGDEFAVLWPEGGHSAAAGAAKMIGELISQPVTTIAERACTTASFGIATMRQGVDDVETLMQQADLALYEAKATGRASCHFFDKALASKLQDRLAIETDLRAAIGTPQLHLAYQPLIELESGDIIGFEALMRWTHPTRGPISPAEFIPVAEQTGLILPLGEFVLQTACAEAASWPAKIKVAVNLSPKQFRTDMVKLVSQVLEKSGLEPNYLELEITESALMHDGDNIQATLVQLRQLGVHLALDDFGTGYSSLSYLHRFPFDKIKVDQSFVRNMPNRPQSAAIVELISGLASRLGMTTTAEGIETNELLMLVQSAGCLEGQGYLFDRPLPPEAARDRLHVQLEQKRLANTSVAFDADEFAAD